MDFTDPKTRAIVLDNAEMLTEDWVALKIDCAVDKVSQIRNGGGILGLPMANGGFLYPDWQFRYDGQPYHDLKNVISVLKTPWTVYEFMVSPNPDLADRTGMEYMKYSRTEDLGDIAKRWKLRNRASDVQPI